MPICPECDTEQVGGRFCGHCGGALPRTDAPDDERGHTAWEDRPDRGTGWATRALVAVVLVAAAVAAMTLDPRRAEPETDPTPAADDPTSTELAVAQPTPPRPVTEAMACPDGRPGCAVRRTDFPGVGGLTAPTPGRDPRHAYVAASFPDGTGALYAIDPTNGIQLWRRPLPGRPRPPVVTPWGTVVVAYGGTATSGLRAFNPDTGDLSWQREAALETPVVGGPVAAGGTLAVVGPERLLLRSFEGRVVTFVTLGAPASGILAHDDERGATFLVQTDQEQVRAYTEGGALLWTRTSSDLARAAVDGRTAIVEAPGHVVGVDVRTGEVWRTRQEVGGTPPIVAAGSVFVTTAAGELVRLSLEDGRELGRTTLPPMPRAFTVEGVVLLAPSCADVTAHDVRTGETLWSLPLRDPGAGCASTPVPAPGGETLLISAGRSLYGLRP